MAHKGGGQRSKPELESQQIVDPTIIISEDLPVNVFSRSYFDHLIHASDKVEINVRDR